MSPVTTVINTHTHADHTSGNVEFPPTVNFVVQANTKVNMEKMETGYRCFQAPTESTCTTSVLEGQTATPGL